MTTRLTYSGLPYPKSFATEYPHDCKLVQSFRLLLCGGAVPDIHAVCKEAPWNWTAKMTDEVASKHLNP